MLVMCRYVMEWISQEYTFAEVFSSKSIIFKRKLLYQSLAMTSESTSSMPDQKGRRPKTDQTLSAESPHMACKRHEDRGYEKQAVAFELLRICRKWRSGLQKCFNIFLWAENFSRALRLITAINE